MLYSLFLGLVVPPKTIKTPYAAEAPLAIRNVSFPPQADQWQLEEGKVDLSATYDDPFDPDDISVDAMVVAPSGRKFTVPGFLYRGYSRSLVNQKEVLSPDPETNWRVRICPQEPGKYVVQVHVRDRNGESTSPEQTFVVQSKQDPGFVRLSRVDHRYFAFDSGKSYFPIGANVCWGGEPGTYSYDNWLPKYGAAGCNYARYWLSPGFTTFALEEKGKPSEGKGIGQFDLANAWRLDQVMKTTRDNGIYAMICLESYNILRDRDGSPGWENAPHNLDNGGPLRIWSDFWKSDRMQRWVRAKLRYVVARYGWDTHVFAWEFWNEVDLTRDFDADIVRDWHSETIKYLHSIDAYAHLCSTSFSNPSGERKIDQLPELDFVQTHFYGEPDPGADIAHQITRKSEWGKAQIPGEVGADATGPQTDKDKVGKQFHDPQWMALVSGAAGSAMPWWWDSLIEPNNLYREFTPLAKFIAGINFPSENFRQTDVRLSWSAGHTVHPPVDLELANGPVSWAKSAANQPQSVTVTPDGATGQLPLSGIQHGVVNHPDLHNPVRFITKFKQTTTFALEIGDVSEFGGAAYRIKLDGAIVARGSLPVPAGQNTNVTLHPYAREVKVSVPKGPHQIIVENLGADWFMAGYRFSRVLKRRVPPLGGLAVLGDKTAMAYIRNEADTYRNVVTLQRPLATISDTVFAMSGFASGQWRISFWDPWNGVEIRNEVVTIGIDGSLSLPLPSITRDLAIKLNLISKP